MTPHVPKSTVKEAVRKKALVKREEKFNAGRRGNCPFSVGRKMMGQLQFQGLGKRRHHEFDTL